ncbi:hypothetical protein BDV25DRAFT_108882 [Aspergillus avenaceus]|uniref:Mitochondrial ribosomal protein L28-domain-containing protein n=1 Tax=Aspergillus avenaceus TaxID=36643 RepID=A0A5N6TW12_ASPAV|nr:hypothetical protein BDV25DRAFT_108882 [Aspergillus avenaceus]
MRLSPVLASLANVFKIPLSKSTITPTTGTRSFSTTNALLKRKGNAPRGDRRVTLIRYFLWHPLTPRPLRFSRTRFLRHWTIHRAWQLFQAQQRRAHQLELQRQWQAMQGACEELRVGAGDGGKLFRKSMNKKGIFRDLFPIEYGRMQTEAPSREGWNHEWKRMEKK